MDDATPLSINVEGALNFVKRRYFEDERDIICELGGCAPGKASKINYSFFNDFLVQTINDGGLKEDDIERLKEFYNSGDSGHSEWGMGARTAAMQLTIESSYDKFYVVDNYKGIEYHTDTSHNLKYINLSPEKVLELNKKYPSQNNETKFTKWIVPTKRDFQDETITQKIIKDLKFRYSMLLMNKEVTITYKGEKLNLNTQPYEINNWDNIQIVSVKGKKNGKLFGNPFYRYKINNKMYCPNSGSKPEEDENIEIIETKFNFEASKFCPTSEQLKSISNEIGINETKINGIILSKKGVLKSTNFILAYGQRNAGTSSSDHCIICLKDDDNKLSNTTVEKNNKPSLLFAVKEFTNFYTNKSKKNNNAIKMVDNKEKFKKNTLSIDESLYSKNDVAESDDQDEDEDEDEDEVTDNEIVESDDDVTDNEIVESNDEVTDSDNEEAIIKNKIPRKEFCRDIKNKQLNVRQSRLLGIPFSELHNGGVQLFQYDHMNGDRNDNRRDNCDIKDLYEHEMKTRNEEEYEKFIENNRAVREWRSKHICALIKGFLNKGTTKNEKFEKDEQLEAIEYYDKIIKLAEKCKSEIMEGA